MPQIWIDKILLQDIDIYFWKIDETLTQLCQLTINSIQLLDDIYGKNKSNKRKLEWLSIRALLQSTQYRDFKILYYDNGKPYLKNSSKYISISHSKKMVVIAISKFPIGIDIEQLRSSKSNINNLFLNEQEIKKYITCENGTEELLSLWTVKEAAYKFAPNKANILGDITIYDKIQEDADTRYKVSFMDGSIAQCYTYIVDKYILSVCLPNWL